MLLTKPEIVEKLRELVAERDGAIHNIGGDCYAMCVGDEIRVAVAVKEFVKQEKSIWIGVPNPIFSVVTGGRAVEGMQSPHPYRGYIVGSHILYKTLLIVPVVPVAQDLVHRASVDRVPIRNEFNVKMVGYKKYVIQGEKFKGDMALRDVDTFRPIETLLDLPRSCFEDSPTDER